MCDNNYGLIVSVSQIKKQTMYLLFCNSVKITRGLIGVLRGDDGRLYFQMLSHDMKQLELQRLKAQAAKIPPKIRVFSFIMLVCFMLIYIVVIVLQILTSLGGLF